MNSSTLKGYLTGLILGDGSIDNGVKKRGFELKSVRKDFIYKVETDLISVGFTVDVKELPAYEKDGVHYQTAWRLYVKSHPYFAKIYHHFYDDHRNRRVTREALGWLNDVGLANWYMSDGYVTLVGRTKGVIKDRRVELATDRYSFNDVLKIRDYFHTEYGYVVKEVNRRRNNQYRLRMSLLSAQHFFLRIAPHVLPSMSYKIILPYDKYPYWMCQEYITLVERLQSAEGLNSSAEDQDIVWERNVA